MFPNGHWSSREHSYIFGLKTIFSKFKILTLKISTAIPYSSLEIVLSKLPFAYSLLQCTISYMFPSGHWSSREYSYTFDLKTIFFKFKISILKISTAIPFSSLEIVLSGLPFAYSILQCTISYMFPNGHWSSREYSYTFDLKTIFSKFKISTLKISTAISLPRLDRILSGLPFAYSLLQCTIS